MLENNSTILARLFIASASSVVLTSMSAFAQAPGPAPATPATRTTPPTVDECLAAHREAQSLRKQLHLRESRELLSDCSHDACPGPVRRDCMRWIDDIAVQMPSVVFRVDTGDSPATSKVKILVDNQTLFDSLPGRAVEMNPGTYRFKFVLENGQAVEQELVLAEGEKFKNVAVRFEPAQKPTPETGSQSTRPETLPPASNEPMSTQTRPVPLATYIFAGVGAAAAINFGVWGIWSESLRSELKKDCAPNCEEEYVDRVRTRGYIADISLGVSVASFAAASIFYFTRPTVSLPVKVDIATLPNGGFAGTILKEF